MVDFGSLTVSQQTIKKIPERKCMGCNEKHPKKELVRVVRTPKGDAVFDPTGKMSGRGAYVCPKMKCLEKAVKTGRISKCLEVEIPISVYDDMREYLSEVSESDGA